MKTYRKYIWIIGILLLANCTNDQKESRVLQVIDIEGSMDKMDVLNLSHFASGIRYIELETRIDNYLSNIQEYLEVDRCLIINNLKQLMLFDRNGKFIRQIGNVGRGPGEYQFVMSMGIINDSILTIQSLYDLINYRIDGSVVNQKRNFFRLNNNNDEYFLSWIILEEFASEVTMFDNPILMYVTFK